MVCVPIPADEPQRLKALRALLILDTPPEERFDRIGWSPVIMAGGRCRLDPGRADA